MPRSTGIPTNVAVGQIVRIIRGRVESQTVTRPTKSKSSLDATTETTSEHTEEIWLFEPREAPSQELIGERVEGSLGGLVVADGNVDLQKEDRVTYGGVTYEIDTIVGHPIDGEPDDSPHTDFWVLSLTRYQ